MRCEFIIHKHILNFAFVAGTSRGVLTEKPTWYIVVRALGNADWTGIGEASPLKGLSEDYSDCYEEELRLLLDQLEKANIPDNKDDIPKFLAQHIPDNKPSMMFGVETALYSAFSDKVDHIFPGAFCAGKYRLPINGLVWMGDEKFMKEQIDVKLKAGFSTIKMKIGAIDFESELKLLENIRKEYNSNEITLRVDANGAFKDDDVRDKLLQLASLDIHSIEQPIQPGQRKLMKELSSEGILPIALDEELIGIHDADDKRALIEEIQPQYLILKPSLIGGLHSTAEWISLAEELHVGWWMTSMLESNIGLNAIAQFTATYKPNIPQGLGTGQLYTNNIESPLKIRRGELLYDPSAKWGCSLPGMDFSDTRI